MDKTTLSDIRAQLSRMSEEEFAVEYPKHLIEFYMQYKPLVEAHRLINSLKIMKR